MLRTFSRGTLWCLAGVVGSVLSAAQPSYNLQILANTSSVIRGLTPQQIESVAMNDIGTVVFNAAINLPGYPTASAVFTPNRVLLKTGDTVRGHTVALTSMCGINNFNNVAMYFTFPYGQAAIFSTDGQFVKTGDTVGGLTVQLIRECTINDLGEIVFSADYLDASGNAGTGVFTPQRVILKAGAVIQGTPTSGDHRFGNLGGLSDLGTFVFQTYGPGPNLNSSLIQTGVFTRRVRVALAGERIGGIQLFTAGSPVISHLDNIAFTGTYSTDPSCTTADCRKSAAFTPHSVIAAPGDKIGGITITGATAMGINDLGTAVILATFNGPNGPTSGLFTQNAVVARVGDKVGTQTPGVFYQAVINDRDDVAIAGFNGVILARRAPR